MHRVNVTQYGAITIWFWIMTKMADSHEFTSSLSCENVQDKNEDTVLKIIKSTHLYLCVDELLWEGDLDSLKSFVEVDLQLSGRLSSPRSKETIKFSNLKFGLKWYVPNERKLEIVQDKKKTNYSPLYRAMPLVSKKPMKIEAKNVSKIPANMWSSMLTMKTTLSA